MPKAMNRFSYYLSLTGLVISMGALSPAHADGDTPAFQETEMPLQKVFVPENGYGSNNNVQLTLDGDLPNSCYQLGKVKVETGIPGSNTFAVHQFADVEKDGVCADGQKLPPHLSSMVPYTYDVSLGRLPAGDYKVLYNQSNGQPQTRIFRVYASKNISADDFPYAAVSTISMPDVLNGGTPVAFDLIGMFTSSCAYLSDVKVNVENDVIVVQPIIGHKDNMACSQTLIPFSRHVELGKLAEGRYLVHARSMSGKSVSHAFSVIAP